MDLFLAVNGANELYQNSGDGTFSESDFILALSESAIDNHEFEDTREAPVACCGAYSRMRQNNWL